MTNKLLNPSTPRVIIVGGGFGGLQAARAMRNAPVQLTVIDRNNHHLFQPLLYQVAMADLSPADISAPIRGILRGQRNATVMMADVTGVDVAARQVIARDRISGVEHRLSYDYLVLATGARESYFGHDEWAKYAPGLKTITDATNMRRHILLAFEEAEMEPDPQRQRSLLTFVVVGGGPTGVELVGTLADLAKRTIVRDFKHINPATARIVLVEASPRLLGGFPRTLAAKAQQKLESLGVEVITGKAVEGVDENGVVIAGEYLPARTVVWAAGVKASPAGQWLGAKTDRAGRVLVNPDLSVPGLPEVFVIGDAALLTQDGKSLPGVAPVAMQEGRYVAKAIRQKISGETEVGPFRYWNKGNLATIGRSFGIADFGRLRLWGFLAWIAWLTVHIFYLIGFRNRVMVMLQWAWAYFTYQRGARLITLPDEGVGERSSARLESVKPGVDGQERVRV